MLLLLLFALAALSAGARAQWRNGQRTHQLHLLPLNSTLRLCSFADQTRLRRYLQPLLVPRVVNTRSHRAAARHIKTSLDDLGFTTEWDNFTDTTPFGPKRFRNLIATWDTQAPRRLVLACHYDSKIFPGQTFIGATDSSVPCAMLLDIAHVLAPYMYKRASNQVGLQLLFFDGEEAFVEWSPTDSIYGSRHLAEKWEKLWYPTASGSNFELSRELDRIDVLMLLDLLGAPNPHLVNAAGNGATQLFAELPKIEQELRGLNCFPQIVPNIFSGALSFSAVEDDHIPFLRRGIPILHLISVPFPSVWHKVTDNESALHFPTIDYLTTVLRVFVAKYMGIAPL